MPLHVPRQANAPVLQRAREAPAQILQNVTMDLVYAIVQILNFGLHYYGSCGRTGMVQKTPILVNLNISTL